MKTFRARNWVFHINGKDSVNGSHGLHLIETRAQIWIIGEKERSSPVQRVPGVTRKNDIKIGYLANARVTYPTPHIPKVIHWVFTKKNFKSRMPPCPCPCPSPNAMKLSATSKKKNACTSAGTHALPSSTAALMLAKNFAGQVPSSASVRKSLSLICLMMVCCSLAISSCPTGTVSLATRSGNKNGSP